MQVEYYPHQIAGIQFLEELTQVFGNIQIRALFMETGTGKTLVTLSRLEKVFKEYGPHASFFPVLILCTKSLTFSWTDEHKKWECTFNMIRYPDKGGRDARVATIRSEYDALVVNYESVAGLKLELLARGFKTVVLDEIQKVKSRTAKQTKATLEIAKKTIHRYGLSGTPIVHSPLDLWSEFNVLGAGLRTHPLGLGSFTSFEAAVSDIEFHPRLKNVKKHTFPDYKIAIVRDRLRPLTFEASKDLLGLPPRRWLEHNCHMEGKQLEAYEEMRKHAVYSIENTIAEFGSDGILRELLSSLDESKVATGKIILTQMLKMQQIASGFLKYDDGHVEDLPNAKLDFLEDYLPEMVLWPRKICVFTRFTHDIQILEKMLAANKIGYVSLHGGTSKNAQAIVHQFHEDISTKILIGQLQVVSVGQNFQNAADTFYFTNSYRGEDRMQSEDRTYRIGQDMPVTYHDLIATTPKGIGLIDNVVLGNNKGKVDVANKTIKKLHEELTT